MNEYTNDEPEDTQPVSDKDQTSARDSRLPSLVIYLLFSSENSFEKASSPIALNPPCVSDFHTLQAGPRTVFFLPKSNRPVICHSPNALR